MLDYRALTLLLESSSLMSLGFWKRRPPYFSLGLVAGSYNNCDEDAEAKSQKGL